MSPGNPKARQQGEETRARIMKMIRAHVSEHGTVPLRIEIAAALGLSTVQPHHRHTHQPTDRRRGSRARRREVLPRPIGGHAMKKPDGITLSIDSQTTATEEGWEHHAYMVTLAYEGRTMSLPFKTGMAWDTDPTVDDVLETLVAEATGWENNKTFEPWAREYDYDTDSRKAERIFHQVKNQTRALKALLGDSYNTTIWKD